MLAAVSEREVPAPSPTRGPMSPPRIHLLGLALPALVAADWASKHWVASRLALGDFVHVVEGWFWLEHHQNPGVAFSTLAHLPDEVRTPLFTFTSLLGIVLCIRLSRWTRAEWSAGAAGLVVAGAVGNLGDRLMDGHVTDFLRVHPFPFVFNVADVAIATGAVLLGAAMVLHEEPAEAPAKAVRG